MADLSDILITQLKNSSAKVAEEKAKADALFSSIGDGAIATDERGKVIRINASALNMLGCTESEIIGRWYPKVIEAEDNLGHKLAPIELPITKSLLEGKPVSQKLFYLKKDGSQLPVEVTVAPIIILDKPIGAIEVFRDISVELELDRAKSEFISLASHQLKTPPNALKWSLEILLDGTLGPVTDKQKEALELCAKETNQMLETINALLNISRIELGTFTVNPKALNYADLARETVVEFKSKIVEKKLTVKEDYIADLPLVPADPGLAKIILDNLIGNAVKYTPAGGSVSVGVSLITSNEDYPVDAILIKVADTGIGIPQAQQAQIFNKMFRAGNVREIEGTGFGLYITKTIVNLAGGKIWFDSVEGKGTTFNVELPLTGMRKKEGTSKITAG